MKNHFINLLIVLSLFVLNVSGQVVKDETKIRFGFGMAGYSQDDINQFFARFEDLSKEIFANSDISLRRFKNNFFVMMEYESEISKSITYLLSIEYHNDHTSGSDIDYLQVESESITFDLTFLTAGFSLAYYYPVFNVALGEAKIFAGLGFDIMYTNVDINHYYDSFIKGGIQEIDLNANGYSPGGKGFVGLEIPFFPSVLLQLRLGYSFRNAGNFSNKIESTKDKPFPPSFFYTKNYDLSGFWGSMGLAYYF